MAHLLLVEDDELLRDGLGTQLGLAGHTVTVALNGAVAQHVIDTARFDGVILDLGLPLLDGMDVMRWIRQRHPALPVLILTARDGTDDRVQGLNAGADDYLTKPFNAHELQARISAMLRRSRMPAFGGSLKLGGLRVDASIPRAWLGETEIELTQREWELLSLLVTHTGQVVSREDVLMRWKMDSSGVVDADTGKPESSNALEVYVHRLRKKLEGSEIAIRNVRGLGYLMERSVEKSAGSVGERSA